MWKNILNRTGHRRQYGACALHAWIPNAKNTHSVYVTRTAFPLQKRLHERASMLSFIYTLPILLLIQKFNKYAEILPSVNILLDSFLSKLQWPSLQLHVLLTSPTNNKDVL